MSSQQPTRKFFGAKKYLTFIALAILAAAVASPLGAKHFAASHPHDHSEVLCEGILPKNDLFIPENKSGAGINEVEFNSVIDKIEKLYQPEIEARGERLVINRDWKSGTVNASATKSGKTRILNFFGGLARHPEIGTDGFALVACHEMGHHLGGIPKVKGLFNNWASNEGQSDYFSTLKCLRRYYQTFDQDRIVEVEDTFAADSCFKTYSEENERQICLKLMKAGKEVAFFFQKAKNEPRVPKFEEPDTKTVSSIQDGHPATQCRLDTYFQGALCLRSWEEPVSDTDANQGTCHPDVYADGVRPRCWFKY